LRLTEKDVFRGIEEEAERNTSFIMFVELITVKPIACIVRGTEENGNSCDDRQNLILNIKGKGKVGPVLV
jgi:hypothetical protein